MKKYEKASIEHSNLTLNRISYSQIIQDLKANGHNAYVLYEEDIKMFGATSGLIIDEGKSKVVAFKNKEGNYEIFIRTKSVKIKRIIEGYFQDFKNVSIFYRYD